MLVGRLGASGAWRPGSEGGTARPMHPRRTTSLIIIIIIIILTYDNNRVIV